MLWLFPKNLQEVWTQLTIKRREEIAAACSNGTRSELPFTLHLVSKKLHFREQVLVKLPAKKLAKHIVAFAAADRRSVDELFRVYFFHTHKKMMSRFLDQLGIQHDDCSINDPRNSSCSRAELEGAVAILLREFPTDDVALYTQVLNCQNSSLWAEMAKISFSEIDKAVNADDVAESILLPSLTSDSSTVRNSGSVVPISNDRSVPEDKFTAEYFLAELEGIKSLFQRTADGLKEATNELLEGTPPSLFVNQLLESSQLVFKKFGEEVVERSEELRIESPQRIFTTLHQIVLAVAEIEKAERVVSASRDATRSALLVLEDVQHLAHKDKSDFEPLKPLRRDAQSLHGEFAGLASALPSTELLARVRPFEIVLKMVDAVPQDQEDEELVAGRFPLLLFSLGAKKIIRSGPAQSAHRPATLEPSLDLPMPRTEESEIAEDLDYIPVTEASVALEPPAKLALQADETVQTEHPETGHGIAISAHAETLQREPERAALGSAEVPNSSTEYPAAEEPSAEAAAIWESVSPSAEERAVSDEAMLSTFESMPVTVDRKGTTTTLAAAMLSALPAFSLRTLEEITWIALAEGKVSTAYNLALALELKTPNAANNLSIRFRALSLGHNVRFAGGRVAEMLKEDFSLLANADEPASEDAALGFRLLLISSALQPALVAPDTNAKALLALGCHKLPRLNKLYWLCNEVMEYSNLQTPLDPRALEYVETSESLTQHLSQLQQETRDWWSTAPRLPFKFTPAGRIWKRWLEVDGFIPRLISPILEQRRNGIEEQEELIERLSTESKIRSEANFTDRQLRGRTFGGDISSSALSVFCRHVRDAVKLAERWTALRDHQPSNQLDFPRKRLLDLRNHIAAARTELEEELRQAETSATDVRVRTGVRCCQKSLENLLSLLQTGSGKTVSEPDPKYILFSDLLLLRDLDLSEEWSPPSSSNLLIHSLLQQLASEGTGNWLLALSFLNEEFRDHESIDRIIEYLSWTGTHNDFLEKLVTSQEAHITQCRDSIKRLIEDCRNKIAQGVALGLVSELDRLEYLDRVEVVEKHLPAVRNFSAEERVLSSITDDIEISRKVHVERVRERLLDEAIPIESPAYKRITDALERGDVDTANEYLELAGHGESLPDGSEGRDAFLEFFPNAANDLASFLKDPRSSGSVLQKIQSGKGMPGVSMKDVAEPQIQEAAEMYEAWSALKKTKRPTREHLCTLLFRLGFGSVTLSESTAYPRAYLSMETTPLNHHRGQSPVPAFGSLANGHYRVICIWDSPSEEEILNIARQGIHGSPAIMLYFGRIDEQSRRYIAQLCQSDNLSFILIDEITLLFLCGERGLRLPTLFQCTLPFTYVSPYTTTSSNVPPEMFYGRRDERTQIIDRQGACFVYGGRQLGKTALLLSIKDEFHNPSEGRIALWVDLRSNGDDLWGCLIRAFKDLPNDELQLGDTRTEQTLFDRLQSWLDSSSKRRILLLLDEADHFLEVDSNQRFSRTSRLKSLMERTKRRFKVVFAGLHNVCRTTKQQNHPLAHFGEPICVGPLLERGEWKEARALIERPFQSMGFRFQSPDLVTKILSRTNYYPSLIQLYCHQLFLSVMRANANSVARRNSPPYLITEKHIEDAYSSPQFGNAIKEKFELTLNLDARYRVLALIIALHAQTTERGISNAMSVRDIRDNAVTYWEPGFRDCRSEEDFRILLEEMSGLGVLREVNGQFALRTPNLLYHFGSLNDIEHKLMKSSEEMPPPPYEAQFFRTSDREHSWRRSPMSVQQENDLRAERNAVTLVFGTKAAGLHDLGRFMMQMFGKSYFVNCDLATSDRNRFRMFLNEVQEKSKAGTTVVLVQNCPWALCWIEEAVEWSKAKKRSHFIHTIFVADPSATWGLLQDREEIEELVSKRAINSMTLQPWHWSALWNWLGDCGIGTGTNEELHEIVRKTGNWPYLLMEFRRMLVDGGAWKERLNTAFTQLSNPEKRTCFLEVFGLDVDEPRLMLTNMASLGDKVSLDLLAELFPSVSKHVISDVVYWADRLSLVTPSAGGEWMVDPIVKHLLVGPESR